MLTVKVFDPHTLLSPSARYQVDKKAHLFLPLALEGS